MNTISDPINSFKTLFPDASTSLNIDFIYENSRKTVYCEKNHRITDEKYILSVCGEYVKICTSGEKGLFRALCDIAGRFDENSLSDGEFVCAPCFSVRGYIEGFYGNPWSHESRLSVMKLMAKNRMNTVYYAPKDDLYHREKWRERYPEEELSLLKELVNEARKYYMDFYWCVAPGLSIKYSSEEDFNAILEKTKQLYTIGITDFGLLLDDIDEELLYDEDKATFGETVNAHIELINKYYTALKDIDSSIRLTVCPTLYHGKGNEYYISKLGRNIPSQVHLFWTGRDICSRELTSHEAVRFTESTFHKPLYWDNYPVNDCAMHNEMHISPIINRDSDLWKYSEGIIANCMEYAECSKIPLITIADYLWDSENYDPQKSWECAIKQVIGKDNSDNFIVFADHLYTSCLKDANSRRMYNMLDKVEIAYKNNNPSDAIAIIENYLNRMLDCRDYLNQDLPVCKELSKWSEKFYIACDIMSLIVRYMKTKNDNLFDNLLLLAEKYESIPAKLSNEINIRLELSELKKFIK